MIRKPIKVVLMALRMGDIDTDLLKAYWDNNSIWSEPEVLQGRHTEGICTAALAFDAITGTCDIYIRADYFQIIDRSWQVAWTSISEGGKTAIKAKVKPNRKERKATTKEMLKPGETMEKAEKPTKKVKKESTANMEKMEKASKKTNTENFP